MGEDPRGRDVWDRLAERVFCFSAFRILRSGSFGTPGSFFNSREKQGEGRLLVQGTLGGVLGNTLGLCGMVDLWDSEQK